MDIASGLIASKMRGLRDARARIGGLEFATDGRVVGSLAPVLEYVLDPS
jgi:hypothetical protein